MRRKTLSGLMLQPITAVKEKIVSLLPEKDFHYLQQVSYRRKFRYVKTSESVICFPFLFEKMN